MTAIATGNDFTLRVPPSWYEFDVWRATRTGDLARLVDERIKGDQRLKPYRSALIKALREAAAQAERQGAVLCAAMTDPIGDDGVLAAVLTVFYTRGASETGGNAARAIASQISATAPSGDTPAWRRVEIVEVADGEAVEVRGVDLVQLGERTLPCVLMETLVPMPDAGGVLNIVLASHQIQHTEPMLDLFEAISGTFAWTHSASTSTSPNSSALSAPTDPPEGS